jgi:hypothetical protein
MPVPRCRGARRTLPLIQLKIGVTRLGSESVEHSMSFCDSGDDSQIVQLCLTDSAIPETWR